MTRLMAIDCMHTAARQASLAKAVARDGALHRRILQNIERTRNYDTAPGMSMPNWNPSRPLGPQGPLLLTSRICENEPCVVVAVGSGCCASSWDRVHPLTATAPHRSLVSVLSI